MYAIRLKHRSFRGETFKQERLQRHALLPGQRFEQRPKLFSVIAAIVGRYIHADEQHFAAVASSLGDHGGKVGAYRVNARAAQAVVAAKLEYHDLRAMLA